MQFVKFGKLKTTQPAGGWTPANESGLLYNYVVDGVTHYTENTRVTPTAEGDPIGSHTDSGPYADHAVQLTTANKPLLVAAGTLFNRQCISFDETSADKLIGEDANAPLDYTDVGMTFGVAYRQIAGGVGAWTIKQDNNNYFGVYISGNEIYGIGNNVASFVLLSPTTSDPIVNDTAHTVMVYIHPDGKQASYYVDGVFISTSDAHATGLPTSLTATRWEFNAGGIENKGSHQSDVFCVHGDLRSQIEDVHTYLSREA